MAKRMAAIAAALLLCTVALVQRADSGPSNTPRLDPAHPDANPGPHSNAEFNSPLAHDMQRTRSDHWQIAASWPSDEASAISSAGVGQGGLAVGEVYGQVTGVEIDDQGRVWVLHRTPERQWDAGAFSRSHRIQHSRPIQGATIVRYASEGATTIDLQAGAGLFQMPHMIKVDHQVCLKRLIKHCVSDSE